MLKNYCRLCGHVKHNMVRIFNGNEDKTSLTYRIRTNLHIPITEDDLLPNTACNSCVETLDGFCEYVSCCQNAQVQLMKLLLTEGNRQIESPKEDASSSQGINNSVITRHLSVRLPKLPLDYYCANSAIKEETVDAENHQFNLVARRISCSVNVVKIKDEKDEALSPNALMGGATEVPEDDIKFEELPQTSPLDIPLEPTPTILRSSSINYGDKPNSKTDEISIHNVINMASHDSAPDNIIHNLNLKVSSHHKNKASWNRVTQLSDLFPDQNIDQAHLQKLGKEIVSKNFPQVVNSAHVRCSYEDVVKLQDVNCTNYGTHMPECNSYEIKEEPVARIEASRIVHSDEFGEPAGEDQQVSSKVKINSRTSHDIHEEPPDSSNDIVPKLALNPTPIAEVTKMSNLLSSSETSSVSSTQSSELYQLLTSKIDNTGRPKPEIKQNTKSSSFKQNGFILKAPYVILDPIDLKMKIRTSNSEISLEKALKCQFCSVQFTQKRTLKKHLWSVHQVEQCSKCPYFTDHHKTLLEHRRQVHNSPRVLICKICDEHFAKKCLLKSHLKLKHPNAGEGLLSTKPNKSSSKRNYRCKICNLTFKFQSKLDLHVKLKHDEAKKLSCPSCPYVTSHKYRLTQHRKEVHEKRFECNTCGKRLGKKSKLIIHFQIYHSDQTPFKCSLCDEKFLQRYPYQEHLKVHSSSDAQWICKHCNCKFDQKHKLSVHISKTHQDKSVKCRQCSFVTSHKYQLTQHVREVHEKRFECGTCGKLESKKSRLLMHIRNKHSEKKMYQCNICKTKYFSKGWYDAHIKNHP